MTYLLQFCGLSDPLQLFYLEQDAPSGPVFAGFRPFQLDVLLEWAGGIAAQRQWELEAIQQAVLGAWLERADLIHQWQVRLREEPADRLVVAGLGSQRDWEQRCEAMLLA